MPVLVREQNQIKTHPFDKWWSMLWYILRPLEGFWEAFILGGAAVYLSWQFVNLITWQIGQIFLK